MATEHTIHTNAHKSLATRQISVVEREMLVDAGFEACHSLRIGVNQAQTEGTLQKLTVTVTAARAGAPSASAPRKPLVAAAGEQAAATRTPED